jgi:hypothetical protein
MELFMEVVLENWGSTNDDAGTGTVVADGR